MVKMNQRARDFYEDYLNLKIYQEMLEAALEHDLDGEDVSAEKMKEICKGNLLGRYVGEAFDDFIEFLKNEDEIMSSYIEKTNHLVADFMAFADEMNNFPKRSQMEKLCEEILLKMGIYSFLIKPNLNRLDLEYDSISLLKEMENMAYNMFNYIFSVDADENEEFDEAEYSLCTLRLSNNSIDKALHICNLTLELEDWNKLFYTIKKDIGTYARAKCQTLYDIKNYWRNFFEV